ncbi:uncharacterized protein FRV6_05629 [Fusarium oxysporum]|uniref:Uncharacterized protein n=1 Tax=Fusarium oxysporum TaxID=5507 RepID=A0A2H3SYA5_FUSOX|nr:uncharacterized protein FRV6_05629 [Fusarium oxysporum]
MTGYKNIQIIPNLGNPRLEPRNRDSKPAITLQSDLRFAVLLTHPILTQQRRQYEVAPLPKRLQQKTRLSLRY